VVRAVFTDPFSSTRWGEDDRHDWRCPPGRAALFVASPVCVRCTADGAGGPQKTGNNSPLLSGPIRQEAHRARLLTTLSQRCSRICGKTVWSGPSGGAKQASCLQVHRAFSMAYPPVRCVKDAKTSTSPPTSACSARAHSSISAMRVVPFAGLGSAAGSGRREVGGQR